MIASILLIIMLLVLVGALLKVVFSFYDNLSTEEKKEIEKESIKFMEHGGKDSSIF